MDSSISRRHLRQWLVVAGCCVGTVRGPEAGIGLFLLVLGAALHLTTKATLEQNRILTTAGPYRWTRNPFYLANGLIDLGILFVIGRGFVAVVYAPIWWVAYQQTIRAEEEHLARLFGQAFEDYRAWVPRLIPHRVPWPKERVEGRIDWANPNLSQGREYSRLLGIALAPAVIWGAERIREEGLGLFEGEHASTLGWILFLPALWVFKLALAETLRRPERALLPGSPVSGARALGTGLVFMPLVVGLRAAGGFADWPMSAVAGSALLLAVSSIGADAFAGRLSSRVAMQALISMGTLWLSWSAGLLWLAVLPVLWLGLSALDAWGRQRSVGAGPASDARLPWRYGSRIASAAVAGFVAVGILRSWLQ